MLVVFSDDSPPMKDSVMILHVYVCLLVYSVHEITEEVKVVGHYQ